MKRIKNVTQEIENEAYKNVEDFDFTQLCFKSIFDLLDENKLFYNAINQITKKTHTQNVKIKLDSFNYGVVRENDNRVYPIVQLIITVEDDEIKKFVFSVTPFNAVMESVEIWDAWNGNCDKELTNVWRTLMKGVFKEKWEDAFETYSACEQLFKLAKREPEVKIENRNHFLNSDDMIESI